MIQRMTWRALAGAQEATAKLIKLFLGLLYPVLEVVLLHSPLDILKYDENVSFVHSQLRPHMEMHRRDAAKSFGEQWSHCLRTTVTLSDGAAARISAIHASLREWRPCYLHMWELKRFWAGGRVAMDDVRKTTRTFLHSESSRNAICGNGSEMRKQIVSEAEPRPLRAGGVPRV